METKVCGWDASGTPSRGGGDPEPYPPLAQLGVVGDRRTAAAIGADGVVRWLCLPGYDGIPVFGSLLDAGRGGFWRLGPASAAAGSQRYEDDTNVLVTTWHSADGELELTDAMLSPEDRRPSGDEGARTLLRKLVCKRGSVGCAMALAPRDAFAPGLVISRLPGALELRVAGFALGLWTSRPVERGRDGVFAEFALTSGEEFWAILELGGEPGGWDPAAAEKALQAYCLLLAGAERPVRLSRSAARPA